MTTEDIFYKMTDALSECSDLKQAMEVACMALASVIAQGNAELDREAFDYTIESLKALIPEWRKMYEESETEQERLARKLSADLMNPDIPIEEIADKYCTFGNDELRQSTIDKLRLMRIRDLNKRNKRKNTKFCKKDIFVKIDLQTLTNQAQ